MEDDAPGFVWQRERILDDWSKSLEYAQMTLMASKTSIRTRFILDDLLPFVKHKGTSPPHHVEHSCTELR